MTYNYPRLLTKILKIRSGYLRIFTYYCNVNKQTIVWAKQTLLLLETEW